MKVKKVVALTTLLGLAFAQEVSFREELAKRYDFVSLSDTQTLVFRSRFGITENVVFQLCSQYGGEAYRLRKRTVSGFGGQQQVVEEKIPIKEVMGLSGLLKDAFKGAFKLENVYAPAYLCEKDGKEVFRIEEGRTVGRYYRDDYCYAQVVSHPPEPKSSSVEKRYKDQAMESENVLDFLRKTGTKVKQMNDGSYYFKEINPFAECYPISSASILAKIAGYCYAKGGVFRVDTGEDYLNFVANISMKDYTMWMNDLPDRVYYCDGSEKFMVYLQRRYWEKHSSSAGYDYQIKEGFDENLIHQLQVKRASKRPQLSAVEQLILQTANTGMPSVVVAGNMKYKSLYVYREVRRNSDVRYVALITEGPGYSFVHNYQVINGNVYYIDRSDDFGMFSIAQLKEDLIFSKEFFSTCRGYGQAYSNYRGYRIDCRTPNPAQACFAELYVSKDGRLINYAIGFNICE